MLRSENFSLARPKEFVKLTLLMGGLMFSTLLFLTTMAFAHDQQACKGDIEKFCKDVPGGRHGIMKCLKDHDDALSTECKAKSEKFKQKFEEMQSACQADVEKLCKDVEPGHMVWKCLKKNKSLLSEGCKTATARDHKGPHGPHD